MIKNNERTRRLKLIALLVLCAAVVLFPQVVKNAYYQRIMINMGIYIILASSLNLLIGYLGLFSLGHAAFYCVGAYTSALLATRLGLPFPVCLLAAGVVSGALGALIGIATLRLSDIFLAFATLGLSEVVRILIQNMVSFTGGPMGVSKIPAPTFFGRPFTSAMYYYLVFGIIVVVLYIVNKLVHSNTGRTLMSVREDEGAARSLGINVFRYKLITMVISCFIAGVAGSIYAHFLQYISASMFTITESVNMIAMVTIGGMGTVAGPIVGAVLLTLLPEMFRFLSEYRQLMYGATLIIAIVFAPKGLVGLPWKVLFMRIRRIVVRKKEGN